MHQILPSPAAVHAARTICKNWRVEVAPGGRYAPSEENLARIIDVATQASRTDEALRLMGRLRWMHPEELLRELEQFRAGIRALELVRERRARFADGRTSAGGAEPAACAIDAARRVLAQWVILDKGGKLRPTEKNLAVVIHVCTDTWRVDAVLDFLATLPWQKQTEFTANMLQIKEAARAADLIRNRLPSRQPESAFRKRITEPQEVRLTREQIARHQQIATHVAAARTVEEQQSILRRANLVG